MSPALSGFSFRPLLMSIILASLALTAPSGPARADDDEHEHHRGWHERDERHHDGERWRHWREHDGRDVIVIRRSPPEVMVVEPSPPPAAVYEELPPTVVYEEPPPVVIYRPY